MIITNSSIGMESARTYTSVSKDAYLRSRSAQTMSAKDFIDSLNSSYQDLHAKKDVKDDGEVNKSEEEGAADTFSKDSGDSLKYLSSKFNEIKTSEVTKSSRLEDDLRSAIRYLCLNFLLMLLIKNSEKSVNMSEAGISLSEGGISFSGDVGSFSASGINFTKITESETLEHYERESEATSFSAKGLVKTSDGREIDFNIDLTMSRSFESYSRQTGTYESFSMSLMDPLVINFDAPSACVSDQKFYFDLDSDGLLDEMTTLSSNSGFLALDKNGDGQINNGSELFGTKSGDGFKDLMAYDDDGNGWIDEADKVFNELKIFCINEDGSTEQYSLKDKNVGAIYLGNSETEFSVMNKENSINAQIRKTGLFLYETGAAGTIQHVDMAVELGA